MIAQVSGKPLGSMYLGARAYSTYHVEAFSFLINQASLSQLKEASVAVYGERRFLLTVLNDCQAVASFPVPSGGFGLHAKYYGFSHYNESGIGLIYARQIGRNVSAGLQFNYLKTGIAGYKKFHSLAVEAGAIFYVADNVKAGIQVLNFPGINYGEKLPFVLTAGLGYDASENFFTGFYIIKEENLPVSINASIQYTVIPQLLTLKAAFASGTAAGSVGVSFWWKDLCIDIVTTLHPQLGMTPGIMFNYPVTKSSTNEDH